MTDHSKELSLADFLPGASTGEDIVAATGSPLKPGAPTASEEAVIEILRTIHDPEIPVNIYDLGLIYELTIAGDGSVSVDMTLTAPNCPVAGQMPHDVAQAIAAHDGVGEVEVKLVWEPAWTQERMSSDARLALGLI